MAPISSRERALSGAKALRPLSVIASRLCRPSDFDAVRAQQALPLEPAQDAAEVAGVEAEVLGELGRGRLRPVGELVEHAAFGERERALQQPFLQHADALRVEAREAPHRGDALLEARLRAF